MDFSFLRELLKDGIFRFYLVAVLFSLIGLGVAVRLGSLPQAPNPPSQAQTYDVECRAVFLGNQASAYLELTCNLDNGQSVTYAIPLSELNTLDHEGTH
jgi:hypothetical protein